LNKHKRIMVAISGASGTVYARRLLQVLPSSYDTVYLTASNNALEIMHDELGVASISDLVPEHELFKIIPLGYTDLSSPPASGSHEYEGLIVVPCSMGVVGRIAAGVSSDLITRAADVCLKDHKKLILVVRETPLNLIHLRNLTQLAEAGAIILPASPAFYNTPKSIDDLVDFVVDRILRVVGTDTRLIEGWGEKS